MNNMLVHLMQIDDIKREIITHNDNELLNRLLELYNDLEFEYEGVMLDLETLKEKLSEINIITKGF